MKRGGKEKQAAIVYHLYSADKHILHTAVYLRQDKIT
jgi:hypothetical protein